MERRQQGQRSHLFTVRIWQETIDCNETEWRGKVQHVESGEVYYFRDWSTLVSVLLQMLPPAQDSSS